MDKTKIVNFACAFMLLFIMRCDSSMEKLKDIMVVSAKFEKIEKALNKYSISYNVCSYSDLENSQLYNQHRAIFFPCGVENTIETNINILSRGTTIHSVSLKKDFFEVNEEKIYKNIKSFIKDGGNAYFSGYSYKLLDGAFGSMEFFDNFPNMGISEKINLELKNDLIYFNKDQDIKVDMLHPGWIVAKTINNSVTLAESFFNTIRDFKRSPIISLLKRGSGEIIYSSYHKTSGDDEISRFIIYRLCYKFLSDKLTGKASFWDQKINCNITDSIREWENFRSYIIPIDEGNNTIYFLSEKGPFKINIYDQDKKLILSRESRDTEYDMNIKSGSYQYLILKVFPGNPKMLGAYSIVSANGIKIIPYYKKALYILLFIAVIVSLYWINKTFGLKKFSGKIRQK
ncbi:MAG: hypothetical protein JXN64_16180 [Spirochaetes bacterium]|nr:hypothetical protein [Spirochaetota bacterium]